MNTLPIAKSGHIKGVAYDPITRDLQVTLGQSTYVYADVPPDVAEGFTTAESPGQHFHQKVRGQFEHNKVETP